MKIKKKYFSNDYELKTGLEILKNFKACLEILKNFKAGF